MSATIVPFPRKYRRQKAARVRVARFAGRWCVERVTDGCVTDRRFMPTQADAQRIAARIARRDKVMLLTSLKGRPRPWPSFYSHTPDDAA